MKNTDIQKIRQLLKQAQKDVRSLTPAEICYPQYAEVLIEKTIKQALALLPCETCNGTGQVDDPMAGNSHMLTLMPCLDC